MNGITTVHRADPAGGIRMSCGRTAGIPGHTGWLDAPRERDEKLGYQACIDCWGGESA